MKDEVTTPDHLPDSDKEDLKREEDLKAAAKRRDEYALVRDQQAKEDNDAIERRLTKDKQP